MKTLEELQHEFSNNLNQWRAKTKALDTKKSKLQDEVIKNDERLSKHWKKCPSWITLLVRPIAEILNSYYPDRTIDILGPFGIRSEVPIWLIKDPKRDRNDYFSDDNILSVSLIPGDLAKSELYFQTGEYTNEYPKNTIGAMNGMNNVTEPLISIDQLLEILKLQQEKN